MRMPDLTSSEQRERSDERKVHPHLSKTKGCGCLIETNIEKTEINEFKKCIRSYPEKELRMHMRPRKTPIYKKGEIL